VDSEGGVKATESKTRFIAPAVAVVVASGASYDARHRDPDEFGGYGGGPNVSGRTLGGGLGLGMLGGDISDISIRGDGTRLLRIGVVALFECDWARRRGRI
jgi:hypothetical protein